MPWGFEFLFPNNVGTLRGWLGVFTKKKENRKGKQSLCVCLVERFMLLEGMIQLVCFFIKVNQDKIFFSALQYF